MASRNLAFGKLVGDNRFIFDPKEKRVTLRSMFVSQSRTPNAPATAIGMEVSSNSPIPKLRAEIRLPKLVGNIGNFQYLVFDAKLVIEITPKLPPPPSMQPERAPVPRPSSIPWAKVIGVGLVVTAGAIVVATIVEDFVTLGAGTLDDVPSFAAAGASLTSGLAMMRGVQDLPQASFPAHVKVTSRIEAAY